MRWVKLVAHMVSNGTGINKFSSKDEGTRKLGRYRRRLEDNI
jgi:hypothetical protein